MISINGRGKAKIFFALGLSIIMTVVIVSLLSSASNFMLGDTYSIGEPVTINLTNISVKDLKISYGDIIYKYQGVSDDKVVFFPQYAGKYEVIVELSNETLNKSFLVIGDVLDNNSDNVSNNDINDSQIIILDDYVNYSINDTINISVNDSENSSINISINDTNNSKKYFIINSRNETLNASFKFTKKINLQRISLSASQQNEQVQEIPIQGEIYDLSIENVEGFEGNLNINNLIYGENIELGLDSVPTDNIFVENPVDAYAINLDNANFTNATYNRTAKGNTLFKCAEWNFENQECLGSWIKIMDLVPGQDYDVLLYPGDPGFVEANIEVLNVQSYPIVGGEWKVEFNTTGTANLTITAINGTTFGSIYPDDLEFLEISCGNVVLNYSWLNGSILVPDYYCNETGSERSKVLTPGKHHLEFRFGDKIAYASNAASVNLTFENFEAYQTDTTTTFTGNWTNVAGDNCEWGSDKGGTASTGTGPGDSATTGFDHTLGTTSGIYVYLETSTSGTNACGTAGFQAFLQSGNYSATDYKINVSFWYHMYGATMGSLSLDVWNGSWQTDVWSVTGQQQAAGTDPYLQAVVDLSNYTGNISLRLRAVRGSSWTSDIAIDDINVTGVIRNYPPSAPTGIKCDNSYNCNINISNTLNLNATGSVDPDSDVITYFLQASLQNVTTKNNGTDFSKKSQGGGGWQLVNTTTGYTTVTTGSTVVNLPAGLQQGDIVLIGLACDNALNADGITGQGYTDIEAPTANALPGRQLTYKVMGASPDSTVSILNNAARTAYVIQAWRGVDTTTPLDVTSTSATGTVGDPDSPSITPVSVGALVFSIGLGDDDDGTITTNPTGYTNESFANTGQGSTTVGATVVMASKVWSSGAENPSVWNLASFSDGWVAWTVALRPKKTSIEENVSETNYTDIDGNYDLLNGLSFKVEVDSYNPSTSVLRASTYPDLKLEVYDGSSWVSLGLFNLTSKYAGTTLNTTNANFTLSTTNSTILSAWQNSANQDFRISGVYMDFNGSYYGSSTRDEINYTDVWVSFNGIKWIYIGNHSENSSFNWNVGSIPEQACIDFRANATDINKSYEYSSYYTKNSCLNIFRNPNVTNYVLNSSMINQSESIRFNVSLTDENLILISNASVKYPNGTERNFTLTNSAGSNYYFVFWDTNSTGIYNISSIVTKDEFNNTNITIPHLTFEVTSSPPGDFDLTSPASGTASTNVNPTLSWQQTVEPNFLNYTIIIDNNYDFSSPDFVYVTNQITNTSLILSSALDGNTVYYWRVVAYDVFGTEKQSSNDYLYITDNTNPIVILNWPYLNSTSSTFSFNFTPSDDNLDNCSLYGNFSGAWELNQSNADVESDIPNYFDITLADNTYFWNVVCFDRAGNRDFASSNITFTVDTQPPNVLLELPLNNTLENVTNNIVFYYNVSDEGTDIDNCRLLIDDVQEGVPDISISEGVSQNFTAFVLNGQHNWSVSCKDTNGFTSYSNKYNLTVEVLSESDPPVVTLFSPIFNKALDNDDVLFNYSVNDASGIENCSIFLDGNLNQTNNSVLNFNYNYFTITGIPEGEHSWNVECYDNSTFTLGNSSLAQFKVDLTNPLVVLNSPLNNSFYSQSYVMFNVTSFDLNLANCTLYGNFSGGFNSDIFNGTPKNNSPTLFYKTLQDGNYLWNVQCYDKSGRSSFNDTNYTVKVDAYFPSFIDEPRHPESANDYLEGQVYYFNMSVNDTYLDKVWIEHNFTGNLANYSVDSNLGDIFLYNYTPVSAGIYFYRWYANDSLGRTNNTAEYDYVVNKAFPQLSLFLNGTDGNISDVENTSFNITAKLNLPYLDYIELYVDGILFQSGSSTLENITFFSFPGIHNVTVIYNATENYSYYSKTNFITINDTINPSVIAVYPDNDSMIGSTSLTFQFNVSDNADIANCSLLIDGELFSTNYSVNQMVTQSFTRSFVDGNYSWVVECFDTSENSNSTVPRNFSIMNSEIIKLNVTTSKFSYEIGTDVDISSITKDIFDSYLDSLVTAVIVKGNSTVGWWDVSWKNRIALNVTETSGSDLTDVGIAVNVTGLGGNISSCDELRVVDYYNSPGGRDGGIMVLDGDDANWCYVRFKANLTSSESNVSRFFAYYNNLGVTASVSPFNVDYSSNSCVDVWGFDCGTGPPETGGDNTFDSCANGLGNDESIETMSVNSTAINAGESINVTCIIDPYTSADYSYIWYYNGTGWRKLFEHLNWGSASTAVQESVVFTPDNVAGVHWVRCGINYNQAGDVDECMDSGSYYDNDDVNFTVNGLASDASLFGSSQSFIVNNSGNTGGFGEWIWDWNTIGQSYDNYSVMAVARKANFTDASDYANFEIIPDVFPPYIFDVLPIQNTDFSYNSSIQISLNSTDTWGVDDVSVNVSYPNGTVDTIYLNSVLGNKFNNSFFISNIIGRFNLSFVSNDTNGNYNFTESSYFNSKDTYLPADFSLTYPLNDTVSKNMSVLFVWSESFDDYFTNYTLLLDNNFDFSSPEFSQSTFVLNNNSTVVSGLASDETYYWKVVAYDESSNVKESSQIFMYTTDNIPPYMFDIIPVADSNYSFNSSIEISVNVTDSRGVDDVSVNVSYPNGTVDILQLNLASGDKYNNSFFVPLVVGRFNLSFVSKDIDDNYNFTESSYFNSVDSYEPLDFDLVSPVNMTVSKNMSPLFVWTESYDDNFANYTILLDNDFDFSSPEFASGTFDLSNNSTIVSGLASDETYYWRVYAYDTFANEKQSLNDYIYITDNTNPAIEAISPAYNVTENNNLVAFQYNVSDIYGINNCRLFIDGSVNETNNTINETITQEFSKSLADGTYFWFVQCFDVAGNINVTETRYVTIDTIPPQIGSKDTNETSATLNDTICINTAGITDVSGVDKVWATITYPNGTIFNFSLSDAGDCAGIVDDGIYSTNINAGLLDGYLHFNTTYANDSLGNLNFNNTPLSIFVNNETVSPVITLISPINKSGSVFGDVVFRFNVSDSSNINFCNVSIDGIQNSTNDTIFTNQTNLISVDSIPYGAHTWGVECDDQYGNRGYSENRSIYVIPVSGFGGSTTNIEGVDISNISNFILEIILHGIINFTEPVDLTNIPDINTHVTIMNNKISINTSAIPELNKSAKITFKGLSYSENPVLFRDGELCLSPDCNFTSYVGGIASYNVSHFSNYTTSPNSKLFIFDESDPEGGGYIRFVDRQVIFRANYSNLTGGTPITGGGTFCQIDFIDLSDNMTYNVTSGLYEYNRSFSTEDTFTWATLCNGTFVGFEALTLQDNIIIYGSAPVVKEAYLNETLVEAGDSVLLNVTVVDDSGNDTVVSVNATFVHPNGTEINVSLTQFVVSDLQTTPANFIGSQQQAIGHSDRRTIGETGAVTTANLTWKLVAFENEYNSTPVVVVTPVTQLEPANQDDSYLIPTIISINSTHMNISICIDNGTAACAENVVDETLHYFVFDESEANQFSWMSVGTVAATTNGADTVLNYGKTFSSVPEIWISANTYNQNGNVGAVAWAEDIATRGTSSGPILGCTHQGTADACDAATPSETFGFVAVDTNLVNITGWQTGSSSISNSAWTSAVFSPTYTDPRVMVTQNDDNGGQDPQYAWARNVTTSGMEYRYCEQDGVDDCDTHTGEVVDWFALDSGDIVARGASVANESNTTYFKFTNIDNTSTSNVYSINVTLDISYFSNSSSDLEGNNNPNIILEMATSNEAGWIEVGEFNITGTGNFSIIVMNQTILDAWKFKKNRDIRVKGINFDYTSDAVVDEINWTSAYVTLDYDTETSLWEYIWNDTSTLGFYPITTFYTVDNNSLTSQYNFTTLNFSVIVTPLSSFDLLTPINGTISADLFPLFVWNETSSRNFVNFTLEIDNNEDFSSLNNINYTFSYNNTSALSDGNLVGDIKYYWRVYAINSYGNITYSNQNNTYITDVSSPVVFLDYPNDDSYILTPTFEFNYTPTDFNLDNCSLYGNFTGTFSLNQTNTTPLNGVTNQFTQTLGEGIYLWNVECSDVLGRNSFAVNNYSVKIDLFPPEVNAEAPANNSYENETNNLIFYYNTTDFMAGINNCILEVDGIQSGNPELSVLEGVTNNFTAFVDNGDHYWQINCTDDNGYIGQSFIYNITVNVTYETDPPVIVLNSPDIDAHLSYVDILFNYTPNDASGIENCSIYFDGDLNQTNSSVVVNDNNYFTIYNVSEGIHPWMIECYDDNTFAFGMSEERNVTVDLTNPVVVLDSPGNQIFVTLSDVSFNYTPTDINIKNCSLLLNESGTFSFDQGFDYPISGLENNFSKNLGDGTYLWNVLCYDFSGRNSVAVSNFTVKIDANMPVLQNESVYPDSGTNYSNSYNYNFNVSVGDVYIDKVWIEHNFTGVLQNYSVSNHVGEIYRYFYNNISVGDYIHGWYANDSVGRLTNSTAALYVVNKGNPRINLTLNNTEGNITFNETGTVNITTKLLEPNFGNLELYQNGVLINNGSSTLSNITYYDTPGVYEITAYYYETQNYSSYNITFYVIVKDITPPQIFLESPVNFGNVGTSNVNFIYNVSDKSSILNCSLFINDNLNSTNYFVQTFEQTQFQVTLADGNYNYKIECYDSSYNYNVSGKRNFTVFDSTVFNIAVKANASYQMGEIANFTTNVSDVFYNPLPSSNVTTDIIFGTTSVPWWNSSWNKRMLVNVTNQYAQPRVDTITVNFTGLTGNISNCSSELRLVKHDGANLIEIPRVIVGSDNSTFCNALFDVELDGSETQAGKYWAYYNNSAAPAYSLTYARTSLNVQRGSLAGTALQLSSTVNVVNASRALLLFYANSASSNPNVIQFTSNVASTNISFDRYASGTNAWLTWELLESKELNVQRGNTPFLSTEAQINVSIQEVDLSKSFIVVYGRASTATGSENNYGFFRASFVNSTMISITRSSTGAIATAGWQVVQWEGANVQSGKLITAAAQTSATINSVNTSRSMLFFSRSISGTTGLSTNYFMANYTTPTNVTFTRNGATGTGYVDWFSVELPGWYAVQRGAVVSSADTNVPLSTIVMNRSFNSGSHHTSGTGTTYSNALQNQNITNTTNLLIDKATTGQTHTTIWQVAEAKSLSASIGGINSWVNTSNGTTNINGLFKLSLDTLYYNLGNYSAVSSVSASGYARATNYTLFEMLPDTSAPIITLYAPNNSKLLGGPAGGNVTFNWSSFDYSRNSTCNLTIDSVVNKSNIFVNSTSYANITVSGFTNGIHYWNVSCIDVYANTGFSETRNFTMDLTPPQIIINYPPQGFNTSNTSIIFNWTGIDDFSANMTCKIFIDGVNKSGNILSINNTPSNITLNNLNVGTHNWNITCYDLIQNNLTSETRNYVILESPQNLYIEILPNQSALINWTPISEAETYNIYISENYSAGFPVIPNVTGLVSAQYIDDNANLSYRRFYKISSVRSQAETLSNLSVGKYDRIMNDKFNLISSPFLLYNYELENGTNNGYSFYLNSSCLMSLWKYNSSSLFEKTDWVTDRFIPATGSEGFTRLNSSQGYFFESNGTCLLTMAGTVPQQNMTRNMANGFNLVPWNSVEETKLPTDYEASLINTNPSSSIITIDRLNTTTQQFEVTVHYLVGATPWGWFPSFNNQYFTFLYPVEGYYFFSQQESIWEHEP